MMFEALERLRMIEDSIQAIEENLPETYEEFSEMSKIVKDGIYKNLEVISEMFIDLCYLLVRSYKLSTPADDVNAVDILIRKGILPGRLGDNIKQIRGFRNILVYRYGTINEELAYENIREGLEDLKEIYNFFIETFE
ncbi:MAG TPA: DUF86 domain-containing protein [Archaeoglobaceae archaeon]|nr:DUF86 domain-containing protein [Archaeoglobaceae archaeon]